MPRRPALDTARVPGAAATSGRTRFARRCPRTEFAAAIDFPSREHDPTKEAPLTHYNVLIVGAGLMGRRHLTAFSSIAHDDTTVAISMCDTDEGQLAEIAESAPEVGLYSELDTALDRPWDGVVVATPAHTHLAVGRRVTDAGFPLLMEKPLALVPDGVTEWTEQTDASGVPVMVAYPLIHSDLVMELRERVRAGDIGTPIQFSSMRGAHQPTVRPDYADTYYADLARGGGVVYDILTHSVNMGEWLLGPLTEVSADTDNHVLDDVDVPDTVHVVGRHGSVMAVYSIGHHQELFEFIITVHGTAGSFRLDLYGDTLSRSSGPNGTWTTVSTSEEPHRHWLVRQAQTFLDVAAGIAAPPCDLLGGLATVRSIAAVIESADTGRRIAIADNA